MTTATIIPFKEIASGILDGEYDNVLDSLQSAINERRKDVRARHARLNGLTLKAGDRVTLHGLSPKFLNDEVVEVVTVNKTRVAVKSIDGVTGFRAAARIGSHGGCTVPLTCVTAVSDDA